MRRELLITGALFALSHSLSASAQVAEGDAESGADIFAIDCRTCHGGMIAPALRGVVGRPIASLSSYAGYSDALKAKGGETWTETNLDTFLTAPGEFAPGTLMIKTLPEATMRADVIAYLKSLPAPSAS